MKLYNHHPIVAAICIAAFLTACTQANNTPNASEPLNVTAANADPVNETPSSEAQETDQESKSPEGVPTFRVPMKNKDTGEVREFEAKIIKSEQQKFFLPNPHPELELNLAGVELKDENGETVTLEDGTVTIIEYWSTDGLARNSYWSQMRALEHEYDPETLRVISINYDMVSGGKRQIEAAQKKLESYTRPKKVYFDLNDGFRDLLPRVLGPVSYYLVDLRNQITASGPGNHPKTEEIFIRLDDALKHQKAVRTGNSIKVVEVDN